MTLHCFRNTCTAISTVVIRVTLFALTLGSCNLTQAQNVVPGDFFFENFEDGNLKDNDPVNWGRGAWNGATEGVVNGDLEINGTRNSGSGGVSILAPRNASDDAYLGYTDAIYRTRAQITELGAERTQIGFLSRSADASGYVGRIDNEGEVALFDVPVSGPNVELGRVMTDLDPVNNDVLMQLSTDGDVLGFSVWQVGDPSPDQPLITATSSSFPFGTFGVFVLSSDNTPASAVFRSVSVSAIPEPTSLTLLLSAGLFGYLFIARRQKV